MIHPFVKARRLQQMLTAHGPAGLTVDTDNAKLLSLAERLGHLPHVTPPTPSRRRLYITASIKAEALAGDKLLQWAGKLSGATLAIGLLLTGIFAANSKPGSPLSYYRNQGQAIRLKLVSNAGARANLQIQYAETRLQETQTVLNDSHTSAKDKVAALSDLAAQTQATVETVKKVAIAQSNSDLLTKLQDITNRQTAVIATNSDPAVRGAANEALKATEAGSKTIAEAKRIVAAANESAIAILPTLTSVSGIIVKISPTEITIDKAVLVLNNETKISDAKNDKDKPLLKVGQQVSVTAQQDDGVLVAKQISITAQPAVKKQVSAKPVIDESLESNLNNPIPDEVTPEPAPIQGGFIIENPAPLYPSN